MRFGVALLRVNCALFVMFGVGFIVIPGPLAGVITGAWPQPANAVIDMRAMYGGMSLGAGLFFGTCARRSDWVRAGLTGSLLLLASVALGRIVGMAVDGSPNGFMLVLLGAEIVFAGLAVAALRTLGDSALAGDTGPAR